MRIPILGAAVSAAIVLGGLPTTVQAQELAKDAYRIFSEFCTRCHGGANPDGELDLSDHAKLLGHPKKIVAPGDPNGSEMLRHLEGPGADMPQSGPRPSELEIRQLRIWIEQGAPKWSDPPPPAGPRLFLSHRDVLTAIHQDLLSLNPNHHPYMRYFTLTNLWNNANVTERELRLYRAALSKLINSLSWRHAIHLPVAIDPHATVYRVDLRELGWVRSEAWSKLLAAYPYGLDFSTMAETRDVALKIDGGVNVNSPTRQARYFIHADWFVSTAARPPLYEEILELPKTDLELERMLKVNVIDNFQQDFLARAGFVRSGVSQNNRLVERHASTYGAYWKSYDFSANAGRQNLMANPLGPAFDKNAFAANSFQHAGGEIIFHLPNGLQGYLLVDDKGKTIAEGPASIVADSLRTAGSTLVVNGVSCMHCHKHGMKTFRDGVRLGHGVNGEAQEKVESLYPEPAAMQKLVDADQSQFMQAVRNATGTFLQVGEDKDRPIEQFPEPIGGIAGMYLSEKLDLTHAAGDLGVSSSDLKSAIRFNTKLAGLGLGPLAGDDTISRDSWDDTSKGLSVYQEAARVLLKVSPVTPARSTNVRIRN